MKKLLTKILSVIVAVTATLGLVMLPKTAVQASEFTFGAVAGASVKYGETIEETGLRFTIEVDKDFYAGLGEGVEFGALLTTKKYASNNDVVIDPANGNIADVRYVTDSTKFDKDQPEEATRFIYYASVTYKFDDAWKEEVKALFGADADIEAYKLQALATELVCRPYYIANGKVEYAELSDPRSMIKVANGAVIDGDPITDDFIGKYLSTVVESQSQVFVEADGTVIGMSTKDKEMLANADSITLDGDAGEGASPFNGDKVEASFLEGKELGKYYYVTAFNGANGYRIKYMYVTMTIDEAEDLHVFTLKGPTEENPYNEVDGYYVVTKDIDASSLVLNNHQFEPTKIIKDGEWTGEWNNNPSFPGNGFNADIGFTGTFDGLGHKIEGLTVKSNGLFGQMVHSVVRNVAFTNVNVTGYYKTVFAHHINRGKSPEDKHTGIEVQIENVYISVASIEAGGRVGILANNTMYVGTKISNVVVEYLANESHAQTSIENKNAFYMLGSPNRDNQADSGVSATTQYTNVYTISKMPVLAHKLRPGIAINQIELIEEEGKITGVGEITDADIEAYLEKIEVTTVDTQNLMYGVKAYDDYAMMAKDSQANTDSLASFSDKYWTIVNGVPYWKGTYASKANLVVTDSNGKAVDKYVLNNVTPELNVALIETATGLNVPDQVVTANKEGLAISGNTIKLAGPATGEGEFEVTVSATVDGVNIEKTIIVTYTDKILLDGKVLYSAADKALDLSSLQKAGIEIKSLEEIDGYIVNGEEVDELDLEVVIYNDHIIGYNDKNEPIRYNYGRDREVTSYEVTVLIDGKNYLLSNVYAYTKVLDEAEDINCLVLKGSTEENPYNEVDGYYILSKNIDATNFTLNKSVWMSTNVYPGNGYNKDVGFRGVLDGQGYTIDGLTVGSCGLFTNMNAPVVKNIAFTNATIGGYYSTLFAKNYNRGKDYKNGFNGFEGLFENVYVSIKTIKIANDKNPGILVQGTLPSSTKINNVVVEYLNIDADVQTQINAKKQFCMFGTSTNSMENAANTYTGCYAISPAPVLQRAAMPGFAENQVEHTYAGSAVTSVGAILDEQVNEVLGRCNDGVTLSKAHVLVGLRTYDDYEALAKDTSDRNKESLATFSSDYWIVKDGVPMWKEVYKKGFTVQAKQGEDVVDGDIVLKDTETEISLDILDASGNAVEGVTVTAPEGIVVDGNKISLANVPTSVESYEIKISAVVEGLTIDKWITVTTEDVVDLVITGETTLKSVKDVVEFNFTQDNGTVYETTVEEVEGITVNGNKITLSEEPSSVGYYEVTVTAKVGNVEIKEIVTINFSNEYEVTGKVLYSKFDQALDLPSLNKAINEVGIEDVENVIYLVDGEEVEELDLEVIISGAVRTRNVDTAQTVSIKLGKKVVELTNVYAYTRLIDEFSDLDWMSKPVLEIPSVDAVPEDWKDCTVTETTKQVEQTDENGETVKVTVPKYLAYDTYDGYYLMTKNLDGKGQGGVDKDGNPVNYTIAGALGGYGAGKTIGLMGVFDGNGYTISNAIVQSNGIFGMVTAGVIKNVGFKDMTLTGNYSCLLAHKYNRYKLPGYTSLQDGGLFNIYVEGTDITYASSNGDTALLMQNNFYGISEYVVIKHTPSEKEKEMIKKGKRSGIISHSYNPSYDTHFKNWFVIGDTPIAYCESSNNTWNKFVFAGNQLKLKNGSDTEYEMIDPTAFAFINSLLNKTKDDGTLLWSPVLTPTTANFVIDILDNVKQYANDSDWKADTANDYSKFDSAYWTIVNGVPTWNTL